MDTKWSSRKLAFAGAWQCVFTVLLIADKLPPETYYNLSLITIGGYFLGNVGEHFAKR